MELPTDFEDLISALSDAEVRFLVVGGYAVIAYTKPRYTKELDILVEPTRDSARRVVQALRAFGAPPGFQESDFLNPDTVVHWGVAPMRVDILNEITGVPSFDQAWNGRITVTTSSVHVPIIGLDALIANKAAINDPKRMNDKKDLKALLAVKAGQATNEKLSTVETLLIAADMAIPDPGTPEFITAAVLANSASRGEGVHGHEHPWLPVGKCQPAIPFMHHAGEGHRFLLAYQRAAGDPGPMEEWAHRRQAHILQHMAAVKAHGESLWDAHGDPTPRALGLVQFAYHPEHQKWRAWLHKHGVDV